jgi:hypothetical protein
MMRIVNVGLKIMALALKAGPRVAQTTHVEQHAKIKIPSANRQLSAQKMQIATNAKAQSRECAVQDRTTMEHVKNLAMTEEAIIPIRRTILPKTLPEIKAQKTDAIPMFIVKIATFLLNAS